MKLNRLALSISKTNFFLFHSNKREPNQSFCNTNFLSWHYIDQQLFSYLISFYQFGFKCILIVVFWLKMVFKYF